MESFVYVLAALIAVGSMAVSVLHAIKRLKESADTIAKAAARRDAATERVKRVAMLSLQLKREIAAAKRRRSTIEMACVDQEVRLKQVIASATRLLVIEEKRNRGDPGFVVKIANPDYASKVNSAATDDALDEWRKGRRFVLWAPDEQKARDKVMARYPDQRGFYIQSVERYAR